MRKIFALAAILSVLMCGISWADDPKVLAGGTKEAPVVWEDNAVEVLSGGWYTLNTNRDWQHKIILTGDVTLIIPKGIRIFHNGVRSAINDRALNQDDGTNGSACIIDGGDQYSLTLEGEGSIEIQNAHCYKYTNDIAEKEREATIRVKSYTQNGVTVELRDGYYINTDPENHLRKDASLVKGIYASEAVTINSGDLYTLGIRAAKNITLNGGTINIDRESSSFLPHGIPSGATLSEISFGLYAEDTLMINGGAVNPRYYSFEDAPTASLEGLNNVKITGGTVHARCIYNMRNPELPNQTRGFYIFGGRNDSDGGVDISGGTVITNYTIDGSNIAISDCIVSADSIKGNGTIAISNSTVNAGGISGDSTITISDSTVSADNIKVNSTVTISDSTVSADSIEGNDTVTVSDSTVNSGYICAGNTFTISGGKVTVSSEAEKNGIEILDGNIALSYSKEDDFITFSKIAATIKANPNNAMDFTRIYVPRGYTFIGDDGMMYDYDFTYDTPLQLLNSTNLTLRPKKYPVRIASDITHGTVSVKPENALPGTEILVTVTPDEGYAVISVRLGYYDVNTYRDYDMYVYRSREDPNVFSFTMPSPHRANMKPTYAVEVRATFSECFAGGTEDEPVVLDNPELIILAGGCYVVESDITFKHGLMLHDDVTLILKDGAAINFGTENYKLAESAIYRYVYYANPSLTIEGRGSLNAYCEDTKTNIDVASYTQKGGSVYLSGNLSASRMYSSGKNGIELSYSNAEDFISAKGLYGKTVKIKDGFIFTDGTNEYDSSTESDVLSALQNVTLRPKDAHSVSIEAGTHVKVTADKTWYFTDDTIKLDVIIDNGYEATVKCNDTEITPDDDMYSFAMPAENVTITAEAKQAVYKITYSLNGGTASPSNPESYTIETTSFTLSNPTKKGYIFDGWTGTGLTNVTKSVTIPRGSTGDREYTAEWTPNFAHWGMTESNTPDGTSDNPYVISTVDGWALLAGEVNNGDDFSGRTFRLDENITATEIIGTSVAGFAGTFDGNSKKLTFNYNGEDDYCAPFLYVDGGTIKNLTVDGTITAEGTHAGGIIGHAGGKTSIEGCKFAGKILTVNEDGTNAGGFVAENSGELTVTESIYSPAYLDDGETEADSEGSATFARNIEEEGTLTITNSYYTRTLGTAQGKELLAVMADTGITVALDENSPNGLVHDGEIIAGEDDTVILDVSGGNSEEGYTFTGYKAGDNVLVESDGKYTLTMPNEVVIITACFETINYSITYNLDGGSLPEGTSNPESYTVETKDFTLNNPVKTGYKFAGWISSNSEEPEESLIITQGSTENLAYTAKWTANTYTVKFHANKGAGEMQSQEYTYDSESSAFRANTFTREGYTFTGWNTEADGSGTSYNDGQEVTNLAAEGEITLYAQWTAITYTITYNLDGGTADNPASYTIESESFTLANPTRDGYTFRGWSGTDIDDRSMTVTISEGSYGNRAYTAAWTKKGFLPKDAAKPEFAYHSLILSGQIGVFFYAYIPAEYDPEKCTVDFSVSGDISQNEQGKKYSETEDIDGTTFYLYKCFINSVQMADKIKATLHYGDNQSISQTYTAKEYLDNIISMEKGAISDDLVELARCIKDYGCYVQPILSSYNHWEIGKKHASMDCEYTYDETDFEKADNATKAHTISSDIPEGSGIQKVEFALILDSNTAIEICLIPKDGYTGNVNVDGRTATKIGSKYFVTIGDISAHKLGDIHTVKVSTQYEGEQEVSFNVKLSALSYVQAAIHDTRDTMKRAVTSLYRYYAATMEYRRNRPDKY